MENVISAFRFQKNFSFRRLSNMISWIYCQSRLAILGCLIGGGLVFALIPSIKPSFNNSIIVSYRMIIFLAIPIFAFVYLSKTLNNFHSKSGGIQYLLLPATALEKFLAEIFFIVLPVPIWFIMYHIGLGQVSDVNNRFYFGGQTLTIFYFVVYLISSLSFKYNQKNNVIIIVVVFLVYSIVINSFLSNFFVAKIAGVDYYSGVGFESTQNVLGRKGNLGLKINYPLFIKDVKKWLFVAAGLMLFIASYFKIKEKEIK